MILTLLHLAFVYVFFWSAGLCVMIPFLKDKNTRLPADPVLLPLAGYLAYIPLLSLLSLFIPLEMSLLLFLVLMQLALLAAFRRRFAGLSLRETLPTSRKSWPAVLLLLPFAAAPPVLPDMWGYHAQSMQWTWHYAAVPGLGNLTGKLAFNFTSFLPASLLSFRHLSDPPFLSLNPFLWTLVLLGYTGKMATRPKPWQQGLLVLLFLAVCHYYLAVLSSSSAESTSAALILLLFLMFVTHSGSETADSPWTLPLLIATSLVLPLIKLSNLPFLLLALPLTFRLEKKHRIRIPVLAAAIYLPWLARNVVLSGYLVYPFPQLDLFSPDWKVPRDIALQDFHWIRSWSRMAWEPASKVLDLPFTGWFPSWFRSLGLYTRVFLIAGLLSLGLLLSFRSRHKAMPGPALWFYLVLAAGLVYWFFLAPDPRFILPVLVLFTIFPWWYHKRVIPEGTASRLHALLKDRLPALFISLFLAASLVFIQPPQDIRWLKPAPFPGVTMTPAEVGPFTVHQPYLDVNCYDYPLPCAHVLVPGLEARGTSLKDGFRIVPDTSSSKSR